MFVYKGVTCQIFSCFFFLNSGYLEAKYVSSGFRIRSFIVFLSSEEKLEKLRSTFTLILF